LTGTLGRQLLIIARNPVVVFCAFASTAVLILHLKMKIFRKFFVWVCKLRSHS
jgi:hypothetical protein